MLQLLAMLLIARHLGPSLFGVSMVFSSALRGVGQIEKWRIWFFGQQVVALAVVRLGVAWLGVSIRVAWRGVVFCALAAHVANGLLRTLSKGRREPLDQEPPGARETIYS